MIQIEKINDEAILYYRIHSTYYKYSKNPEIVPKSCFKPMPEDGDEMSVWWAEKITPEQVKALAENPKENRIVKMKALDVRSIKNINNLDEKAFSVEHTPYHTNPPHPSHAGVCGWKKYSLAEKNKYKAKFQQISSWIII